MTLEQLERPTKSPLLPPGFGKIYHHITRQIQLYFSATTSPVNLAIFRIVLFGTCLSLFSLTYISFMADIPKDLVYLPVGLGGWIFHYLPVNSTLVHLTGPIFIATCITGMIGLCTRPSAWITLILGFYLLGIPQLFGKVNHYHHLLWFMAILAVSRCADVLSVDALFQAWKRADQGRTAPPDAARQYALPLRFVWLLIGIIYLFPGLAKLKAAGLNWALSDNLKYQLYAKWFSLNGWMPFFRIDHYPLLYKSAALGSILFELSFIVLIFYPKLRIVAAMGGLLFHNMTRLLMRIAFPTLQTCYVSFFDWHRIFHGIGQFLFRQDMYVVYDGNCQLCRRTIASLRVFDVLGRITYVNALDEEALTRHGLDWLDRTALLIDMHAVVGQRSWLGFNAYRRLSRRIPLLWLTLPLLYLPPIPWVGHRVYRHVADHRTCSIVSHSSGAAELSETWERSPLQAIMLVGFLLIAINVFYGLFGGTSQAYPFTRYPTFAQMAGPTTSMLEIVWFDPAGKPQTIQDSVLKAKMAPERYMGLMGRILEESPEQRPVRLAALWRLIVTLDPTLASSDRVQFYKVTLLTDPEQQAQNPVSRELLYELEPNP